LRALLRENAAAAGVGDERLRLVADDWEAAEVSPAALVLCANVLMPLAEIGPFIRKLDAHTLRRCVIILRATAMDAPLVALWRRFTASPTRARRPTPTPSPPLRRSVSPLR
jgi:hypothetical protein